MASPNDIHLLPEKAHGKRYPLLKGPYQNTNGLTVTAPGARPGPQLPAMKQDAASLIQNNTLTLRQKLELTKDKPQDRFEIMVAEVKKNPDGARKQFESMPKELLSLDGLKLGGNARNEEFRMVLQALPSDKISLVGADLSGQNLDGPNMNLRGANFAGANLTGTTFRGADLTQANFDGATLRDTKFNGAQMAGAKLTNIKDAAGADFSDVKGNGIVLTNSDLRGAKFFNTDFSNAVTNTNTIFGGTSDLSQLKLDGVSPGSYTIRGGTLSNAPLNKVTASWVLNNGTKTDQALTNNRGDVLDVSKLNDAQAVVEASTASTTKQNAGKHKKGTMDVSFPTPTPFGEM